MNFKDQPEICVLNAPESFTPNLEAMQGVTVLKTDLTEVQKLHFGLAFVTQQAEVDAISVAFAERLEGDGQLWFAYPKGSSKRYKCEFNRDSGWAILGELGFEGVRMVAIDEDWSALRFRRAEFIKDMTRGFAMSESGKARTAK
ncbi:MAG: hypothetical protein ACKVUS_03730 [Saprospiraceae bacterium]